MELPRSVARGIGRLPGTARALARSALAGLAAREGLDPGVVEAACGTMAAARWQTEHSQFAPGGDSVERCNSLCAPLGYKYFGLQAGHACFCGNSFGSMGAAPQESDCSARCRANQTEICGGADFNSVYEVVQV